MRCKPDYQETAEKEEEDAWPGSQAAMQRLDQDFNHGGISDYQNTAEVQIKSGASYGGGFETEFISAMSVSIGNFGKRRRRFQRGRGKWLDMKA